MNTCDSNPDTVEAIERWLHNCVLGLSLCPYARAPVESDLVRISLCESENLLSVFDREIEFLQTQSTETTLIVLTSGYERFLDFNDQLGELEDDLLKRGLDDQFQLAGFHPNYLFASEPVDDASHYTNRSPLAIVQLLRTASVSKAVELGDTLAIPARNVDTLRALSKDRLKSLFPWSQEPT